MDNYTNEEASKIINNLFVNAFNHILFLEELYINEYADIDITITEVHVLEAVYKSENTSMGSISNRLMITDGTLTTSVNKLIKKGLLIKERDILDKRIYRLKLTETAADIMKIHNNFHQEMADFAIRDLEFSKSKGLIKSLENLNGFFEDMKKRYNK